ncbi:hypothetical protein D3C86_1677270 [compost metagenome]
MFTSDNDLYEDERIKRSTQKEILYILHEYIENKVSIRTRSERTWYRINRMNYYIKLSLPAGGDIECRLPCINQINFGL